MNEVTVKHWAVSSTASIYVDDVYVGVYDGRTFTSAKLAVRGFACTLSEAVSVVKTFAALTAAGGLGQPPYSSALVNGPCLLVVAGGKHGGVQTYGKLKLWSTDCSPTAVDVNDARCGLPSPSANVFMLRNFKIKLGQVVVIVQTPVNIRLARVRASADHLDKLNLAVDPVNRQQLVDWTGTCGC